jgi:deoxyadenosine/deoxycytidine kinase
MANIWTAIDIPAPAEAIRGNYIAVSGNTGAGKSTLIREISRLLSYGCQSVIAVDERHFHHPLLTLMFAKPKTYALAIQLNFAVHRTLFLRRSLENRHTIVVERSHLDDRLFMEDHLARGNVSRSDFEEYLKTIQAIQVALPHPDIWIFLEVSPEISRKRIKASELAGERPVEFPNDSTMVSYIMSWHQRYHRFYQRLLVDQQRGDLPNTKLLKFSEKDEPLHIATLVASLLR